MSTVSILQYLQVLQDDEVAFLICTDVAARGLDVTGVPYGERWLLF